jgi:hypothetical protein
MKLLARRTRDLADVEDIIASGIDRDLLRTAVRDAAPDRLESLEKLFVNVDRAR